jgi:hypothetical protein
MMHGFSRIVCALLLLVTMPIASFAQQRDRGGSGGRPAAPVSRPAPPAARAAPVQRAAPQTRPAPSAGGFNFNRDITARPAPVQQRPAAPVQQQRAIAPVQRAPLTRQQAPAQRPNPPTANFRRAPNSNTVGGPYQGRFHGAVVRNTRAPASAWGWNRGVVWRPAPVYWGGGFWGPFAIAALTSALLFGSIVDYQNQVIYPSYQVEPDTPGEQLLQDYGLQQTQCGPSNLVVIWGPDNSVVCAFPNDSVAPGNYEVDPSTFTLVPES